MKMDKNHYDELLGLDEHWTVSRVDLNKDELRVDLYVNHTKVNILCPECGKAVTIYDHCKERVWRHLDVMEYKTFIHCRIPRSDCPKHGIKKLCAPWAESHSRYSLKFESYAVSVLLASRSVQDSAGLLGLSWDQLHSIMEKAVKRGLAKRAEQEVPWLGLDEKSFRKGHRYASLAYDIDGHRVLEVKEGRDSEVAEELINEALNKEQREMVCGVAIDMSAPYKKAIRKLLVNADIVHDKFHISKHLNDAVNLTRAKEHRKLMKNKDDTLKGSKFIFLKGFESLSDEEVDRIESLKKSDSKVAEAWFMKELFRHFWQRRDKEFARSFFNYWLQEALKIRVPAITKVARMLERHLEHILTYFDCYITNALAEGFNSKIQSLKSNARGFRNFSNYRTRILFFCGKLNLHP